MNTCRIATEKTTGHRYLVQRIDFRSNEVCCWGEVRGFKGLGTKHGPGKTFKRDAVEVTEVAKTQELVIALAVQMCVVEGRAWRFTRGGNLRIGPTQEEAAQAKEFNEALRKELSQIASVAKLLGL